MCHRLALVGMATKIWDSTSNNETIVQSHSGKMIGQDTVFDSI